MLSPHLKTPSPKWIFSFIDSQYIANIFSYIYFECLKYKWKKTAHKKALFTYLIHKETRMEEKYSKVHCVLYSFATNIFLPLYVREFSSAGAIVHLKVRKILHMSTECKLLRWKWKKTYIRPSSIRIFSEYDQLFPSDWYEHWMVLHVPWLHCSNSFFAENTIWTLLLKHSMITEKGLYKCCTIFDRFKIFKPNKIVVCRMLIS